MNEPRPSFVTRIADDPDLGTDPIPAHYYYDPEWYELERQAIFMRTWLQVGHVCELPSPGTFVVRELEFAKASILIARGKDGNIRAFHNVCTHRGTQLVQEAAGKRSAFTCRYHGWTFNQDGALRAAPDFERFYTDKKSCALKAIAVDVCAGLIFVNLDPEPKQDLRSFIGEELASRLETLPVARATTFSEYIYEVDANWKLTYDNFQEQYHIRFIHSRSGAGACGEDNPFGYPTDFAFFGPHRTETIWSNPAPPVPPMLGYALGIAARFTAERGIAPPETNDLYFALFPNFFQLGSAITHFSHVVLPISATRSRGVIRLYWIGEDSNASERFAREYATRTALEIHSEDIAVIEAGQRGLSSGALAHINFQVNELLCRHLIHEVRRKVEAYQRGAAR